MSGKPTWTILLVDAQPISLSTLKNQLEYYQYNVLTASDARSCITLFQERQREIDLVVLDLNLKDAPGTKVLQILRKLTPTLKIIVLTDQGTSEGRPEFEEISGVLRKPVRTDRLLAVVAKALGRT